MYYEAEYNLTIISVCMFHCIVIGEMSAEQAVCNYLFHFFDV